MTRSEEDAEDVVQETFLKAYRNLPRFAGQSEFSTWIHSIAAHCAVDLLRRRAPRLARTEPLEAGARDDAESREASPEHAMFGSEVGSRVARSLERLSVMERTAFVLRHFEGRTIAEIGKALGVRSGAAKNCVFRAVAKLREDLAPIAGVAR